MASCSRTRKCKNKADSFCYICGIYALTHQRRNILLFVKRAYKAYFQVPLGDQEKIWAPHIVCHNCEKMLWDWTKGKRKGLPFGIDMVLREPKEHLTDCYFCLVNTKGIGSKNRLNISYPRILSAIRPVLHSYEFPPPVFNGFVSSEDEKTESEEEHMEMEYKKTDTKSEVSSTESKKAVSQQFNQLELNGLVQDLDLSKQVAGILASRLNEKHVLHSSEKVSFYGKRDKLFLPYFKRKNNLFIVKCIRTSRKIGHPIIQPRRVATFLDSFKRCLKCVLLHNENRYGAVPVGHSTVLKKQQDDIKTVVDLLKYHEHGWMICVDLKIVSFLLAQKKGYTKFSCFLCMWDSRDRENH